MATYEKDKGPLREVADRLISKIDAHKWIKEVGVKIDFIWAYGARDEDGELQGNAITDRGLRAFGKCKIVSLKDRAMGRGDAEIMIDRDWYDTVDEAEREALLDHELTHLQFKNDADDLGRPKLKIRKHTFEFGWFTAVAARHGKHSLEMQQATQILEQDGQFYWPSLVTDRATVTIKTGEQETTVPLGRFSRMAQEIQQRAVTSHQPDRSK